MKKLLILFVFTLIVQFNLIGQACSNPSNNPCSFNTSCELVKNGSFEFTNGVPNLLSGFNYAVCSWDSGVNGGSADLFCTASTNSWCTIPCNYYGTQTLMPNPNCSSNNYYGGIINCNTSGDFSEYIRTQLTTALSPNTSYIISFWVSKGENYPGILNALGIWLTTTPQSTINSTWLGTTPNLVVTNTAVLNDYNTWQKIELCFNSGAGGQSYLTIGRPSNSFITQSPSVTPICVNVTEPEPGKCHALYIDNVSIKPFVVNVSTSSSSVNVCGNVSFSSSLTCGSGSLSPVSYNWSGPGLSSNNIPNPIATVTSTSLYNLNVNVFDMNNTQCVSNSQFSINSVTLNPITVTASNLTVCPGTSVSITGNNGIGSYTFYPGALVGTSFNFSPTVPTTYTVVGKNPSTCNQTVNITINTFTSGINANATPASICIGQTSTLTASGGSNYTWQPGNLNGASVTVSPLSTTIYTVTGTSVNGCIVTKTVQVTVNPLPTITISPATSNTICIFSSINLTASGASSYIWQPGNLNGASINVTPTVTTIYTVTGTNSLGCVNTSTAIVYQNPLPNITCNSSNSLTCPGKTLTLSANGVSTYTWFPGNMVGQNVVVAPSVSTNYTVIGTAVNGCTNLCVVNQSVYPTSISFFTAVATPTGICNTPPYNTNSTLTVIGTSNYTWVPVNLVNSPYVVNNPGTYTATSTYTNGCVYSSTVDVEDNNTQVVLNPTVICTTQTVDLYTLSAPILSGLSFSVNGTTSSNTFNPVSGGVYTVVANYTAGIACTYTAATTITVNAFPVVPTISASTLIACANGTHTLTASPFSIYGYTWQPGNIIGNPAIITPTALQVYTVSTGPPQCMVSNTITIDFDPTPCSCIPGCSITLNIGSLSSTVMPQNNVYCLPNDLIIYGAVTFSNSDLRMYPNISITVTPNSTLTLAGCHLYSCDNMWKGIVVQQGGKLNIIDAGSRNSFIEDAFVAVDLLATNNYTSTNLLNVTNAMFNRNEISIRINAYKANQVTYPYIIRNCLFTSRTITFSPLTYPATNTVKNSASGNSSPLQAPYISNTNYPLSFLKGPLNTDFPSNGIVINDNGFTLISTTNVYRGIAIGAAGTASFNCFDNLFEDITIKNSNVTIYNSVFQNGQQTGSRPAAGKAIYALSENGNDEVWNNNQINILSATTNTLNGNYFYEKLSAADITGYLSTFISYARVYSFTNGYNYFNTVNVKGDRGFNIKTNRYYQIDLQNNQLYNIKNSILVGLDVGYYNLGSYGSGNGRIVGRLLVSSNTINRHPTTPTANEYVNIGVSISDPFSTSSTTFAPLGVYNNIINNRISNVHNGIAVSNIAFRTVSVTTNSVSLVNEPNTFITPVQNGIAAYQTATTTIHQNSVTGVGTYTNESAAIKTSMNNNLSVRCNTTSNTFHGLNFNGGQPLTTMQDNSMQNQKYGLSLTNNATISVQGNASTPVNNRWLGSWTGVNKKTMNYNLFSSAQASKIYVNNPTLAATENPNGSSTVIATPGAMFQDDYFHAISNPSNTILNSNYVVPSCRLSGGGGGGGASAMSGASVESSQIFNTSQTDLLNGIAEENVNSSSDENLVYINKLRLYEFLKANPNYTANSTSLQSFYNNASSISFGKITSIEEDFVKCNINQAQTKVNTLSASNAVLQNYKSFYQLFLKSKNGTFNNMDSLDLINLSSLCPYTEGGSVYKARALYNIIFNTFYSFSDNCNSSALSKGIDNLISEYQDVTLDLKSSLFPNPNFGNFNLKVSSTINQTKYQVDVFDIKGTLILNQMLESENNIIRVKTNLVKGIYTVKVYFNDGTYDLHKLIVD